MLETAFGNILKRHCVDAISRWSQTIQKNLEKASMLDAFSLPPKNDAFLDFTYAQSLPEIFKL